MRTSNDAVDADNGLGRVFLHEAKYSLVHCPVQSDVA
jgi:hypothetical protein